jgi:hypothetical protein
VLYGKRSGVVLLVNKEILPAEKELMCCHEDSGLDNSGTWCCTFTTLVVTLLVGVPSLVYGCSDTICPFQDCFLVLVTQDSTYSPSIWTAPYNTQVQSPAGACVVQTTQGLKKGDFIDICISRADGICRTHGLTLHRLPVVAIINLMIAAFSFVVILFVCTGCDVMLERACVKCFCGSSNST